MNFLPKRYRRKNSCRGSILHGKKIAIKSAAIYAKEEPSHTSAHVQAMDWPCLDRSPEYRPQCTERDARKDEGEAFQRRQPKRDPEMVRGGGTGQTERQEGDRQ